MLTEARAEAQPPATRVGSWFAPRAARTGQVIVEEARWREPTERLDAAAVRLARGSRPLAVAAASPHRAETVARALVIRSIGRPPARCRCQALQKWRLKRLERYLSQHIDTRLTLADMAAAAGLSKMHFAAQFRAATGFRPHQYLLLQRIERAKSIIATTRMPLVEVALATGFNAQAHFSKVFNRFTGSTPVQWKRKWPGSAAGTSAQAMGRME